MNTFFQSRPLTSFVILAYTITWVILIPEILDKRGIVEIGLPHYYEPLAAFGPFIAALIVANACDGRTGMKRIVNSLTIWRVPVPWFMFSILSPFGILWVAAFILFFKNGALPDFSAVTTSKLATTSGLIQLVFFGAIVQSLGEEPGWRGFYLSGLRRYKSALVATLIMGPYWFIWHIPSFYSNPNFGMFQFVGLMVGLLSAAFWFTLIYDKTRSVLMVFLFHTILNITRGFSLSISTEFFLTYAVPVIVGAIVIGIYFYFSDSSKADSNY